MPFKKGDKNAGSKPGVSNFTKNKPGRDALDRVIKQSDGAALRSAAEALIHKASEGDVPAIRELFDRVDGKVINEIDMKADLDVVVELVRWEDD
jgi:hypothetical protein